MASVIENIISKIKKSINYSWSDNSARSNVQVEKSFPDYPYPSLRDNYIQDATQWLNGKALDDGAEGLWRIYDDLYDFSDFISKHPGGKDWLQLTKGIDITEAFETHHLSTVPKTLLSKYRIQKAAQRRNYPFTFEDDGFYQTLKKRVKEDLKNVPKNLDGISKKIVDILLISLLFSCIILSNISWGKTKYVLYTICGCILSWIMIAAHNFFHQRDNWRMYLFDLGLLSYRNWRMTHSLSHHLFTNTFWDFEVTMTEPVIQWFPKYKNYFVRFASIIYVPLLLPFNFDLNVLNRLCRFLFLENNKTLDACTFIPLTLPSIMYLFGKYSLYWTLFDWLIVIHVASFAFGFVGITAAHHHPEIFHEGDTLKGGCDWGAFQVKTAMDREDINKSYFLVLTNYGNHVLHHLFPTLDHIYLPYLQPTFRRTCEEFNLKYLSKNQIDLIVGQFRQIAKIEPNR